MKKFLKSVPGYGWAAAVIWLGLNCSVYYGTRLLPEDVVRHGVALPLDGSIPLVPWMIVIYILAYFFWGISYLRIAQQERNAVWRFFIGAYIAKIICLICFLAYPTAMERPEVVGSYIFSSITCLIYRLDAPNNLFPSIHCLESWLCFRGLNRIPEIPRWKKLGALIFALLVCASTVLVRQHFLLDIPSGILAGEIGLAVSGFIWKKEKMGESNDDWFL